MIHGPEVLVPHALRMLEDAWLRGTNVPQTCRDCILTSSDRSLCGISCSLVSLPISPPPAPLFPINGTLFSHPALQGGNGHHIHSLGPHSLHHSSGTDRRMHLSPSPNHNVLPNNTAWQQLKKVGPPTSRTHTSKPYVLCSPKSTLLTHMAWQQLDEGGL